MFFGSVLSDEQGWRTVLVAFPLIALALWGLNALLLDRLKTGKADYSREGSRRRSVLFCLVLAAAIILVAVLMALVFA